MHKSKENHQVMFDMSEMIDEFLRTEHPEINEENKIALTDIIFNGVDSIRGQYWGKSLSQEHFGQLYLGFYRMLFKSNKVRGKFKPGQY